MFRILSIDGGGIKGVFPAAFLAELEKETKQPISKFFDLISGTSTGGIIALGLGLGLTAAEITQFYIKKGPSIFRKPSRFNRGWFGPKYESSVLRDALNEVFGGKLLGESSVRLLIPSFNATSGEIHIYKTRHHERFRTDHRVKAVDVALATTAAPTYFASHRGAGGVVYVDGGLWANNPVANAVVEAITWLQRKPEELEVLSIGCTQFPQAFADLKGLVDWGKGANAMEAALRGQSGGSLGIGYSIAGHDSLMRINPIVPPGTFELDKADAIPELAAYAYGEARKAISDLHPRFLATAAPAFTPFTE